MIKILLLCNNKNILALCSINDENVKVLLNLNWPELTHLDLSKYKERYRWK